MPRRKEDKIPIYSEVLRSLILRRMSISKLGKIIAYDGSVIRYYLRKREMTLEMVMAISSALNVDPIEFTVFSEYCRLAKITASFIE
jgi:hypothetical protein